MFIDNNLLIYVIIIVKLDVMLYRWLVFLFNYNFKFNYKIGKFNRDVDGLFCRFVEILLNVIKVLKLVLLVEKEECFLVESIVLLENVIFEKVSEDKEM